MATITSCEYIGEERTHDLELEHEDHQFYLDNGLLTSNSHALSYSIISYQCAWLMTYHRDAWLSAFLDVESADTNRKETAVQIAKSFGYVIGKPDVNESGLNWSCKNNKLIPSLGSIRGLGDKAIEEILEYRPFLSIEDYAFHKEMTGRGAKNKRTVDALCRSGGFECLIDNKYPGSKMMWDIFVNQRPKSKKKLEAIIEEWDGEYDFSTEEEIQNTLEITGAYPLSLVIGEDVMTRVRELAIPGISNPDGLSEGIFWGVIHKLEEKVSKRGKPYLNIYALDDSFESKLIRCWNFNPRKDKVDKHKLYLMKLKYSSKWGYSVYALGKNFISI